MSRGSRALARGNEVDDVGVRISEPCDAVPLELVGQPPEVDASGGESVESAPRGIDAPWQGWLDASVVPERHQGRLGQGRDRVGADELFHVADVPVVRI